MVLIGTKGPGLEESIVTLDRSRFGIGEVRVAKIGISAIGEAVHAVRQKRRRKYQKANH
jgi:hypothetical protein